MSDRIYEQIGVITDAYVEESWQGGLYIDSAKVTLWVDEETGIVTTDPDRFESWLAKQASVDVGTNGLDGVPTPE